MKILLLTVLLDLGGKDINQLVIKYAQDLEMKMNSKTW
jgi:hypothetical protein